MLRISSGWTLVLRIFIPVFYTVFMLAWIFATIKAGDEVSPVFETLIYKIVIVLAFILMLLIFYFTVWKLKRLDVSPEHIYVTDYFKTFRYSLESIESISKKRLLWMHFLKIKLKEKGSFGDQFLILIESSVWEGWIDSHPDFARLLK